MAALLLLGSFPLMRKWARLAALQGVRNSARAGCDYFARLHGASGRRIGRAPLVGTWRSLVAHYTGGVGVAGSNPVVPTSGLSYKQTCPRAPPRLRLASER